MTTSASNTNLTNQQLRALSYQAQDATIRLVDETDARGVGSGVAIRLGGMFFVATAAHVLPQGHQIGIPPRRGETWVTAIRAQHRDEANDVGVLELQYVSEASVRNRFLTGDKVLTHSAKWPTDGVVVAGYPEEYIFDTANERLHGASAYLSGILPSCQWPSPDGLNRPPVSGRDIFVHHEPDTAELFDDPPHARLGLLPARAGLPDVPGMSGGGIWLAVAVEKGGLWYPSVYLVAIQVDRHRKQNWVRGTLMQHWLNLVASNYPDLRGAIAAIMGNSIGGEPEKPSDREMSGRAS